MKLVDMIGDITFVGMHIKNHFWKAFKILDILKVDVAVWALGH